MVAPVPDPEITTEWSKRGEHWTCDQNELGLGRHTGRDYHAPLGTEVFATKAGTVVDDNWGDAFGDQVIIETNNIRHLYAHLSQIDKFPGDPVVAGQRIGLSGESGNTPGGPHLHYEERVDPYHPHCEHDRKPQFDREGETDDMTEEEHKALIQIRERLEKLDKIPNLTPGHSPGATLSLETILSFNYKRINSIQSKTLDILRTLTQLAKPLSDEERQRLADSIAARLIELEDELTDDEPESQPTG